MNCYGKKNNKSLSKNGIQILHFHWCALSSISVTSTSGFGAFFMSLVKTKLGINRVGGEKRHVKLLFQMKARQPNAIIFNLKSNGG